MNFLKALVPALLLAAGCTVPPTTSSPPAASAASLNPSSPPSLVVWISIDGFRPSYLARAHAPFLKSLLSHSLYTCQLTPPYPSLTFASHTTEVTGASPSVHGIPGNEFFDRTMNELYKYPPRPDLIKAEPIWTTATKAGQRVAVFDWPFSQNQKGLYAAAYCADLYSAVMTDDARLQRLIDVLEYDMPPKDQPPLSLVMGYVEGLDKAGHREGPLSNAPVEKLEHIDPLLANVYAQAQKTLAKNFPPGSQLYFLITTDHGMSQVKYALNLKLLMADVNLPKEATLVVGGGTGHIFLPKDATAETRDAFFVAVRGKIQSVAPAARVFTHNTLPKSWSMLHPDRIGDIYIDLPPGYTFISKSTVPFLDLAQEPATRPADRAPRGMHSYDPESNPEMLGFSVLTRYPTPYPSKNLGKVDARQIAPTLSTLLGIPSPPQAELPGLAVPK